MGMPLLITVGSKVFGTKPIRPLKRFVRPLASEVIGTVLSYVPLRIQQSKMYLAGRGSVLLAWDMVSDRFEPGTTALVRTLVKPGMTFIDIGAHIGYYSLIASSLVGDTGKVYAFEAEPLTFKTLSKNLRHNKKTNVEAFHAAVADKTGEINLYQSHKGTEGIRAFNRTYRSKPTERGVNVPSIALDDFFRAKQFPKIDVIKIDIDGGEPIAIKGMMETLRSAQGVRVVAEIYPLGLEAGGSSAKEYLRTWTALGFTAQEILLDGSLADFDEERLTELLATISQPFSLNVLLTRN